MTEPIAYAIEILVALILVPWFTWATMAIFNLRQEQAVLKMEVSMIKEVRDWIRSQKDLKA